MKSVLISIQPYWVFLIIAKTMGWNIGKKKTVEVRKNYPKDENWDKVAKIYCSKDKKSFAKIPKEYQPLMEQFLGKVIGEFVCDEIIKVGNYQEVDYSYMLWVKDRETTKKFCKNACLDEFAIQDYLGAKGGYGWHISSLVIYDKPRELSEFKKECKCECDMRSLSEPPCEKCDHSKITRPPQSWMYCESEVQGE